MPRRGTVHQTRGTSHMQAIARLGAAKRARRQAFLAYDERKAIARQTIYPDATPVCKSCGLEVSSADAYYCPPCQAMSEKGYLA